MTDDRLPVSQLRGTCEALELVLGYLDDGPPPSLISADAAGCLVRLAANLAVSNAELAGSESAESRREDARIMLRRMLVDYQIWLAEAEGELD